MEAWHALLGEMDEHLRIHDLKLDDEQIMLSPMLTLDSDTEQFVGDGAEKANAFLKREYRTGYEVPEIV